MSCGEAFFFVIAMMLLNLEYLTNQNRGRFTTEQTIISETSARVKNCVNTGMSLMSIPSHVPALLELRIVFTCVYKM